MFCSEVWGDSHWADSHIQLPEWTDYRADFSLLNGRVWPDTVAPHAPMTLPRGKTWLADQALAAGADRRQRRTDGARRTRPPAIPAAVGPRHLQRRRARAAALCQPGLPRGGDDAGRHQDARGRQGRHADEGARRHRHQLRGQHRLVRRRREHRRDLHRAAHSAAAAAAPGWATTPTCSTTAPTSGRTTGLVRSEGTACPTAAGAPRCACIRAGRCRRRTIRTTWAASDGTAIKEQHHAYIVLSPALVRPGAQARPGVADGRPAAVAAAGDGAGGNHRQQHGRRGLHHATSRTNPTFTLDAREGYIQLPDGTTMYMWSYAAGGGAFQHPGPVLCVNEGDTVTVILTNSLPDRRVDHVPRPGQRAGQRRTGAAAVRRHRHADLADQRGREEVGTVPVAA